MIALEILKTFLFGNEILSPWCLRDLEGLGNRVLDRAAAARPREGRASVPMQSMLSRPGKVRKSGQYLMAHVSPAGIVHGPRPLVDAGGWW